MDQLGARDLRRAHDFALRAHAVADLQEFRHDLVPSLRHLVPCHTVGHTEIDRQRGLAFSISDAPALDGVEQRFLELAHQHPMVGPQRRGDLSAKLISDFLSERDFHRLELYNDIYRQLGVEDQLACGLADGSIVAIHLTRSRRTFTERDRQILELLRPHLLLAYRRARETEQLGTLLQTMDDALERHHVAILQLDGDGLVQNASAATGELLEAHFPGSGRDPRVPPRPIRDQLKLWSGQPVVGQRTFQTARGRLTLRREMRDVQTGGQTLLLKEERPGPPTLKSIRSLGVTTRQAQVLRLLACGKSTGQVAAELGISQATVRKHLEHIYERLGVSSLPQTLALLLGGSG